jgi:hypothetical protein
MTTNSKTGENKQAGADTSRKALAYPLDDFLVSGPVVRRYTLDPIPPGHVSHAAIVTRVVGNTLVYVTTKDVGTLVFTPDKIKGYRGEPLKNFGIQEGATVDLTLDPERYSVLSVG